MGDSYLDSAFNLQISKNKMTQKIIQQGAEAIILLDKNKIIKRRVPKSYRIKEIDEKIRKLRTRSETKLLEKARKIINVPIINDSLGAGGWGARGGNEDFEIQMPFIPGKKLSDFLDKFPLKKQKEICMLIGKDVAKLHDNDIIHGDLTTSNMIHVNDYRKDVKKSSFNIQISSGQTNGNKSGFRIFFIDFGLGSISHKIEDKAVDLHLLKEALEARHFENWKILFESVLKGYEISKNSGKVIEQFKKVEQRGRYKGKY